MNSWPRQEQENKRVSYFQLHRVSHAEQLWPSQTKKTSYSPSGGKTKNKKTPGEKSPQCSPSYHQPPNLLELLCSFLSLRNRHSITRTSGEMVPDSLLTFLVVRMFSVLMISAKVISHLCPWTKWLVHTSKQTSTGISWEVRPINSISICTDNVRQLVYQETLTMQFW